MGVGASVDLSNPFPVDDKLQKLLTHVSKIATHLLSSSDIYDIKNLSRPGSCGDYAIFLRKGIQETLLPFVASVDGKEYEVLYQNPLKAVDDQDKRKKICGDIANSMIKVIATVVACLGSIQIVTPSSIVQRGGATSNEVVKWLVDHRYIGSGEVSYTSLNRPIKLIDPETSNEFTLTLAREGVVVMGTLTAKAGPGVAAFPPNPLSVELLAPINVPNTTQSVLPIRIRATGLSWMVGVLFGNVFKSIGTRPEWENPFEVIESIYRRAQGGAAAFGSGAPESRASLTQADRVFSSYLRERDPQIIFFQIKDFLQTQIPGWVAPRYAAPGAGLGLGLDSRIGSRYDSRLDPRLDPRMGLDSRLDPRYESRYDPRLAGLDLRMDNRLTAADPFGRPGFLSQRQQFMRPYEQGMIYDIPIGSVTSIRTTLDSFSKLITSRSSPAVVRARTLVARSENRIHYTEICNDPYWTEPRLSNVYPWATLQFLCMDDYEKRTLNSTWTTTFVRGLQDVYKRGDRGSIEIGPDGASSLESLRFSNVKALEACKTGERKITEEAAVTNAIAALQQLYNKHVNEVWTILRSLIIIIKDNEKGVELVRLHPKVLAPTGSKKYIEEKATAAREAIAKYYVEVERVYHNCFKQLDTWSK